MYIVHHSVTSKWFIKLTVFYTTINSVPLRCHFALCCLDFLPHVRLVYYFHRQSPVSEECLRSLLFQSHRVCVVWNNRIGIYKDLNALQRKTWIFYVPNTATFSPRYTTTLHASTLKMTCDSSLNLLRAMITNKW